MLVHMRRTTLVLEDDLFRHLKQEAAANGRTIRDVVNALLRRALAGLRPRRRYRLKWPTARGRLRPGVNLDDRATLYDLMEGR